MANHKSAEKRILFKISSAKVGRVVFSTCLYKNRFAREMKMEPLAENKPTCKKIMDKYLQDFNNLCKFFGNGF